MTLRSSGTFGVAAILLLVTGPAWSAISNVGFDLSGGSTFNVGQVFTLNLDATNWTQALDGGGVDLQFNSSVLALQSVAVNESVFDFAPQNGTINNTLGTVSDVTFNALFNPSPSGNFTIASFQFVAESSGVSSLGLSVSSLNPFSSGGVQLNPGASGDFSFSTDSVSVSSVVPAVPEPPTAWLMCVAAGVGLIVTRKRSLRRNQSA